MQKKNIPSGKTGKNLIVMQTHLALKKKSLETRVTTTLEKKSVNY